MTTDQPAHTTEGGSCWCNPQPEVQPNGATVWVHNEKALGADNDQPGAIPAGEQRIDPTCSLHGMKWSQHETGRCLYCCLCFRTLTVEECHLLPDGDREDVCNECAEKETAYDHRS